jgi:prepilin-type N-terminal cleavage/methylation domain-containing protein
MVCEKMRGFTLIELTMVVAILAILSVPGAYIMSYLVQNSVFIPNKLNVDMIGQDVMDVIIEGDTEAKGLRFSRLLTTAGNSSVQFKNVDNQTVGFTWDAEDKKIYRSIDAGPQEMIPYYLAGNISIINIASNPIFTYYDINEAVTTSPASARRVEVGIRIESGTGNYSDWQGRTDQISSVAVRKFE